jgi:dimethylglycine dehydrogenase
MNTMRIEKGYAAMGSELTTEITPVEAGLHRFIDTSSPFVGREAVEDRLALDRAELDMVLVYCEIGEEAVSPAADPASGTARPVGHDCRGNEPLYHGDELVGLTTSGTWGHSVDRGLAFAYVQPSFADPGTTLEVKLLGERRPATVLAEPAVDPKNEKPRA